MVEDDDVDDPVRVVDVDDDVKALEVELGKGAPVLITSTSAQP